MTAFQLDDFGNPIMDDFDGGVIVFADDAPVRPKLKKRRLPQTSRGTYWTPIMIIATIRDMGGSYSDKSGGLRRAAERVFGSWADACRAAGVEPPKRGRPRK